MSFPNLRLTAFATACLVAVRGLSAQEPPQAVVPANGAQTNAAQPAAAPAENRYDIFSKMIGPMAGVLLGGSQSPERTLTLRATVGQVAGRLPKAIRGAFFKVQIQYPGRIRVEAPVLGETLIVCRDGTGVWAVPGSKIQFLLGQFRQKPRAHQKNGAPLQLPFTAQQAVLLPALFQLDRSAEVAEINGVPCRVISGGLMPEIGKAAKAEDFSAKLWICAEYTPKRIDIRRNDFAMSFVIEELTYGIAFAAETWQPPAGATDIYRCDADQLEQLLYVLMNSLQMSAEDKPWLNEAIPATPQGTPTFGPAR